ncbi:uncharacterized protein [Haliotis asinina]|uniref:uncharacterized protein n=1 Tax=Haliotis asinina TaxID=109174 RepID=UPI003531848A
MPRKNSISTNDPTEVESLTFTNHVTYVKFGSQLELSRCENQSCGCSRVHCPFCGVHNFKPSRPARVRDHLNQTHFKHAVLYRGRNLVKCYMQCDAAPGHFHCPHCPKQLLKKAGFLYHLRNHLRKAGKPESLVQAPNFKHPQKVLFDGHVIQLCSNQCEGTLGRHYHCPLCEEKKFEEMGSLSSHLWRCREIRSLKDKPSVDLPERKNVEELWKANMAFNTTVPHPREKFGSKCHMSVVRNLGDLPLERCQDQGCCRNRFHCTLCPSTKFKLAFLSHLQEHYLSHWNSRAVFGAYSYLVCYQPCLPRYGFSVYHYHCPVCGQSRRRKTQFINHLQECLQPSFKTESTETDIHRADEKEDAEEPHQDVEVPCDADYGEGEDNTVLEKTVSNSLEETAVIGDAGNKDVSMEMSEQRTNDDQKKAMEVFNTVLAILSPEFISSLAYDGPVEDLLRAVAMDTGIEWLSSPGVNSNPVYSISGEVNSIVRAKQMLRQSLPMSLQESHQEISTSSSDNDASVNILETPRHISDAASHASDTASKQGVHLKSNGIQDTRSRELQYTDDVWPALSNFATNHHSRSSRSSWNTQANTEDDISNNLGEQVMVKQETPSKERLINALEMLSSAVEIVKKKEESQLAGEEASCLVRETDNQTAQVDFQITKATSSVSSQEVFGTQRTRKRGHVDVSPPESVTRKSKRKLSSSARQNRRGMRHESPPPSGDALNNPCSDKEVTAGSNLKGIISTEEQSGKSSGRPRGRPKGSSGRTTQKHENVTPPTIKRYSTRGNKVDFSLLATGKKRKEAKPDKKLSQEKTPPSTSPHSQTLMIEKKGIPESQEIVDEEQDSLVSSSKSKGRHRKQDLNQSEVEYGTSLSKHLSGTTSVVSSSKSKVQEDESRKEKDMREGIQQPRVEQETGDGEEDSESILQGRLKHNTSPSVSSSQSWTQTEMEVSDEVESAFENSDDEEVTSSRASYRLVYSSMAVVPVVTFNMQSQSMSRQLIGTNVKKNTYNTEPRAMSKDLKRFDCPLCEFQSDSFLNVVSHCSKEHETDDSLHCNDCMVICLDEDSKEDHKKHCHKGRPNESERKHHACPQCSFTSEDFAKVSDHLISEHDVERLRCDVCERVFSQHKAMDIHLSMKHGPRQKASSQFQKPSTKCPFCSFDEDDFQALSSHLILEHDVTSPLRCDVCERVLDTDSDLEAHLNNHHGPFEEGSSSNRCSECGMVCKTKTTLIQHQVYIHKMKSKKNTKTPSLECKTCYFKAKTVQEMREHRLQHKLGVHECKDCNMTFNSKPNLQFHMQLHHKKSHPAKCDICGKVFKHKRYIIGHRKRHFGTKKFKCSECGKAFYEKCTLKAHEQIHKEPSEREYRFVCPFCGNRYSSKSNFNDHLNKHTGEKPYKCTHCDKSFGFRSQLAQHRIFAHSTDRPFKCKECNKSFKMASKLQQHMIGHTGTSKHMCERCNQAYCTSASLRIHQQKCRGTVVKKRPLTSQVSFETNPNVVTVSESEVQMAVMNSYVVMNHSGIDLEPQLDGSSQEQQTEIYLCSVCEIGFTRYEDAKHHIDTEHEEMGVEEESVVMVEEECIPEESNVMVDPTIQLTEISMAEADTMSETSTRHVVYHT